MTLTFTIPGVPVAQPRARATAAGGKPRLYEARQTHAIHAFKATVALAASAAMGGAACWTEPLRLSVQFVFARPQRLRRKCDPAGRILMAAKPDIDNLLKAVLDALNGVVYADDRQVGQLCDLSKWYAAVDEAPSTTVLVEREVTRCPPTTNARAWR